MQDETFCSDPMSAKGLNGSINNHVLGLCPDDLKPTVKFRRGAQQYRAVFSLREKSLAPGKSLPRSQVSETYRALDALNKKITNSVKQRKGVKEGTGFKRYPVPKQLTGGSSYAYIQKTRAA